MTISAPFAWVSTYLSSGAKSDQRAMKATRLKVTALGAALALPLALSTTEAEAAALGAPGTPEDEAIDVDVEDASLDASRPRRSATTLTRSSRTIVSQSLFAALQYARSTSPPSAPGTSAFAR